MNKLSDDQIQTLSQRTALSTEKIGDWHSRFMAYISKNGQLSKKNFIKLYKELLPEHTDSESFCFFVFKGIIIY